MCWSEVFICGLLFFFFKQKTAYEMRISDWSSDVCSSDLSPVHAASPAGDQQGHLADAQGDHDHHGDGVHHGRPRGDLLSADGSDHLLARQIDSRAWRLSHGAPLVRRSRLFGLREESGRSEEHTSELQSLMRISYAVFCLK